MYEGNFIPFLILDICSSQTTTLFDGKAKSEDMIMGWDTVLSVPIFNAFAFLL